ncbi:MAG: tetratricopeptide repeat protein [Candidatus Omnitrophica bacterium]|nr:tetratricopeptide repeat protein [Candidatus Omnitrophota bacterium]
MSRTTLFLALIMILSSTCHIFADEVLWDKLQDRAAILYQQQKYDEAVKLQREALEVSKKTFGPEDNKVAESMDNLAVYLHATGNNIEAEELYDKALAILEKNLKPNDRYLAIFMNYLASFYRNIGKEDKAKILEERARKIRKTK